MITKITIKNVASYKEETSLETESKVNLVYGLNGSGKTIISNYLQNLHSSDFEECSVEGFDDKKQKVLVYNQRFIEENFYEQDSQKGIFTLAKENVDAQKKIKGAEEKQEALQEEKYDPEAGADRKLKDKEEEIKNATEEAQDKVWEIKTKYTGGDRIFDEAKFLERLKKKGVLFNYLIGLDIQDTNDTIEDIRKELQGLGKAGAAQRQEIKLLQVDLFEETENDPIFQEEIIGSQNSSVAELIKTLRNSDWVRKGLDYISEENKTCPFCQEETLTKELQQEIKNYFSGTYQRKIENLRQLLGRYERKQDMLKLDEWQRDYLNEAQKGEIERLSENLHRVLRNNLATIEKKIRSPSQKVSLEDSKAPLEAVNTFINTCNEETGKFNKGIMNREETLKNLKARFWRVLRKEYAPEIDSYRKTKSRLEKEKGVLRERCSDLETDIEEQRQIISDNQKEITNIEQTIEEINKHLLDFGIQDFSIIKCEKDNYRVQRGPENGAPCFKSLSEGEKMVISFLYFLELCKGKESREDKKEKIVVIDDPISSLSHMYIFNVAQLIKERFCEPGQGDFIQCFVLTHSLYFFHELAKGDKNNLRKLFRVVKKEKSSIEKMKHSEIKNDYEAYWDIIKNASQETMPLVANAMRNIIEYFFGFIEQSGSIREIFQQQGEFSDSKFQSFKRYMDRESHSDSLNINDYKEFKLDIFKKAFEQMFKSYRGHYEKYMGIT